ncbi:hypothetical protein KFK09_009775 [Dendrobium nobile]|uniref:Reverse transcriptase zinc-binding domain-containing protein n=1 Tax=Dendrobium nobile TaxID=94219 RepID=A0A8T3BKY1_DENNO|nr:hypothetical protein KFK09_009775 [Dendrobium nobile]
MKEFYKDFPTYSWANLIWHKKHVLRYSAYAWLALVGGLKIADALNGHNIPTDLALFFFCHSHNEGVSHMFFECHYSFAILSALILNTRSLLLRPTITYLLE